MSCKSDLFDVLDADLSGELEFEEMATTPKSGIRFGCLFLEARCLLGRVLKEANMKPKILQAFSYTETIPQEGFVDSLFS